MRDFIIFKFLKKLHILGIVNPKKLILYFHNFALVCNFIKILYIVQDIRNHMIVWYSVETVKGPKTIPVEIQIRTLAMDFWAPVRSGNIHLPCGIPRSYV